jgi:hypothetical protein
MNLIVMGAERGGAYATRAWFPRSHVRPGHRELLRVREKEL